MKNFDKQTTYPFIRTGRLSQKTYVDYLNDEGQAEYRIFTNWNEAFRFWVEQVKKSWAARRVAA